MNKPIFILGCTKSGTTLLRNLFDNHPDLFAIPMESHFFQNIKYWVSYYQRRTKPEKLDYQTMKENLTHWIVHMNTYYDRVADNFTKGKWNIDRFKQVIESINVENLRDLSDLYVTSMYYSLYNSSIDKKTEFIEKSVENNEFAMEWKKLYPQARFVYILRNPYSNFVSFRKYINKNHFPFLKGVVYSMYNSYYFLFINLRLLNDYKVVIYEDLLAEPEKIIKDLTNFLDIDYNTSLLHPTLLGESWGGNSTSDVQYTTISPVNLGKWKDEITDFEIHIVNALFRQVLEEFGFEQLHPKRSKFLPAKKEGLINYIYNRALWRMMPKF